MPTSVQPSVDKGALPRELSGGGLRLGNRETQSLLSGGGSLGTTQCWGCTADPQQATAEPCGAGGEGSNLCPVVTWDSGLHFADERMTSD